MQKNWFIIEEGFHRGPFHFEEIKNLYKQGKVQDESKIWKEGLKAPVTFLSLAEAEKKQLEKDIPAIPGEAQLNFLQKKAPPLHFKEEPPAIPKVPEDVNLPFKKSVQAEEEFLNISETLPAPSKVGKIFGIYFAIICLVAIIVGGAAYTYLSYQEPKLVFPLNMSVEDHERLSLVLKKLNHSELIFESAFSKNRDEIWFSINDSATGELELQFRSYPERTLDNLSIVGRASGKLENFLVSFKQFEFERGQSLVPGVYRLKVMTKEPLVTPWIERLKQTGRYWKSFEVDFYIGPGDVNSFLLSLRKETKLAAPVDEILQKPDVSEAKDENKVEIEVAKPRLESPVENKPVAKNKGKDKKNKQAKTEAEDPQKLKLIETEEKLKTLLSLVQMTDEATLELFNKIQKKNLLKNEKQLKKEINAFENFFVREISPMLTGLASGEMLKLSKEFGRIFMSYLEKIRQMQKTKKLDNFEQVSRNSMLEIKEFSYQLDVEISKVQKAQLELAD